MQLIILRSLSYEKCLPFLLGKALIGNIHYNFSI